MKDGDIIWKRGSDGGYEGPGTIMTSFKNWMGQKRYVVGHKIEGGKGWFYHIYSEQQIFKDGSIDER